MARGPRVEAGGVEPADAVDVHAAHRSSNSVARLAESAGWSDRAAITMSDSVTSGLSPRGGS